MDVRRESGFYRILYDFGTAVAGNWFEIVQQIVVNVMGVKALRQCRVKFW